MAAREEVTDLTKKYEKTEDDLKALQSVGQIIGEVSLGSSHRTTHLDLTPHLIPPHPTSPLLPSPLLTAPRSVFHHLIFSLLGAHPVVSPDELLTTVYPPLLFFTQVLRPLTDEKCTIIHSSTSLNAKRAL